MIKAVSDDDSEDPMSDISDFLGLPLSREF